MPYPKNTNHRGLSGHIERNLYLLVACAILPALLIILYSGFVQRDQALTEANIELENLNTNIANSQLGKISQYKMLLKTLAAMPEVKNLDIPHCNTLFSQLLRDNPGVLNVYFAAPSGDVLASALASEGKVNEEDRAAFQDAMRTKKFSAGEYVVGKVSKKPAFQFGYPVVLDDGTCVGVLLVSYDLEEYNQFFSGLIFPAKSRLILLDRNGVRLIALGRQTESPPIGEPVVRKNWDIVSESKSDKGQFEERRYDGLETLFHYQKLRLEPDAPPFLFVVTDTPRSVVLAGANQKLATNLIFLLLAALLAMVVARMLGQAFVGRQIKALAESENRYALAMKGTNDGLWDYNVLTKELFLSPRAKEILGFDLGEISSDVEEWKSRIHPDDVDFVVQENIRCVRGETSSFEIEYRLRHKDGGYRWVLGRGASLKNDQGEVLRIAGAHTDITEHKQMRELMIQTEKMMCVGGLAAGMAHEINNPLGGIMQCIQVIQRRVEGDTRTNRAAAAKAGCSLESIHKFLDSREIVPLLQYVRESGARAAKIVTNMLEFSRKSDSDKTPVNMGELLDTTIELCASDYDLKKKYDFRKIQIQRDYDPDLPHVVCTASQIEQVLMNILRNAAQAMPRQADNTAIPTVVLRTRHTGEAIRIEVEDNGPGMTETVRKRIFDPFFTTKPVGEGTGLGLSVSYFIITENHKGTIEVESAPGKGSKFIIHLPLNPQGSMG